MYYSFLFHKNINYDLGRSFSLVLGTAVGWMGVDGLVVGGGCSA